MSEPKVKEAPAGELAESLLQALEQSASIVVITDTHGVVQWVNRSFSDTTGYTRTEAVGKDVSLLKSGQQTVETYRELWATIQEGRPWKGVFHNRRKDGSLYWARATISPVRGPDGTVSRYVAVQEDVTRDLENRRSLEAFAEQQSGLHRLGRLTLEESDMDDLLQQALGIVRAVLQGSLVEILQRVDDKGHMKMRAGLGWDQDKPGRHTMVEDCRTWAGCVLESGEPAFVVDHLKDASAPPRATLLDHEVRSSACIPIPGDGKAFGILGVHETSPRHYTEDEARFLKTFAHVLGTAIQHRRDRRQIEKMARHDPLTGLANRWVFRDEADKALAIARRNDWGVGILFIDMDDFKSVNDTLGHTVGDRLLTAVADRVRRDLREGETMARIGGDEFAILLGTVRGNEPEQIAQRILKSLDRPFDLDDGNRIATRCSIGIAVFPEDGDDLDELLGHSDRAMYRAKTEGGRSYCRS